MAEALPSRSGILPDIPTDVDFLGFAPYANTLRDLILDKNTRTPLTIGIFGSWGSGKTSLMKMIKKGLEEAAKKEADVRPIYPIWFNAWLYSKESSLWRALISQVLSEIRKLKWADAGVEKQLDELEQQLFRAAGPSELGSLSITAAALQKDPGSAQITLGLQQGIDLLFGLLPQKEAAGVDPGDNGDDRPEAEAALEQARSFNELVREAAVKLERQRIESLEQFQKTFQDLVDTHNDGFLIIFVDDLDRCLPEKAVEILEAMKLFMDAPGCVFILGIDREVVERGIRLRYGEMGGPANGTTLPFLLRSEDLETDPARFRSFMQALSKVDDIIDGGRYLEKIIQVPFTLPPIKPEAMGRYIAELGVGLPENECGQVFARGLELNPRQVKRAINIFSLLWNLYKNREHEFQAPLAPVRLAKLVVIQQRYEPLYQALRSEPAKLIRWEKWFQNAGTFRTYWQKEMGALLAWDRLLRDSDDMLGQLTERKNLSAVKELSTLTDDYSTLQPDLSNIPFDEWPALATLLTMHPPGEQDYTFASLSETEIEAYVFLTRTVQEAVTQVQSTPAEKEVEQVYLPEQAIVIESFLDPQAFGYISASAFRLMESMREEEEFGRVFEDYAQIADSLKGQGNEIFMQLQRTGQLPADLLQEKPALFHIPAGQIEWQVPWEMVYDRGGELAMDGFWGFRHIIQRPLLSVGGAAAQKKAYTKQAALEPDSPFELLEVNIQVQEAVNVLLVMSMATEDKEPIAGLTQLLQDKPGVNLYRGQGEDDALTLLRAERADIVIVVGRGNISGGEINLMLDDQNILTRRILRSMGVDQPGWSATKPGSALFYLLVDADLGRSDDWPVWLDLLYNMGAGGVIAPLTDPLHSVPQPDWPAKILQRFMTRFLEGKKAGLSLREARRDLMAEDGNPLGLTIAHYGPASQRLVFAGTEETSAIDFPSNA